LFHSIVSNHAFIDGEQTHWSARRGHVRYGLNGWLFDANDTDLIHLAVDVAIGNSDVPAIIEHFSKWAQPVPDPTE
jgi:prophage maintenance system killer protein